MLTVNMTGRATGTALISRTSMSGTISRSGAPRISDSTITTASSAPTMTKSQRTTLATTASMWSFGRACLHQLGGAAEVGPGPGQHDHAVAFAPADDGPRRQHVAGRLVDVLRLAGEGRLVDAQRSGQELDVRRDDVARAHADDVAGDQLAGGNDLPAPLRAARAR